jgi:hypothetical protein
VEKEREGKEEESPPEEPCPNSSQILQSPPRTSVSERKRLESVDSGEKGGWRGSRARGRR